MSEYPHAVPTPAVERVAEKLFRDYESEYSVDGSGMSAADFYRQARDLLTVGFDIDETARVDAETTRCSWNIPRGGHPYDESCLYKRDRIDGQVSHGACWDEPYARATALRAALLGDDL